MLNEEHIKNHFILNPSWEKLYKSKFNDTDPKLWTDRVKTILEDMGYTFIIERYSDNPKSKMYNSVYCISINKDGEELYGRGDVSYKSCHEQLFIDVICEHIVDFG